MKKAVTFIFLLISLLFLFINHVFASGSNDIGYIIGSTIGLSVFPIIFYLIIRATKSNIAAKIFGGLLVLLVFSNIFSRFSEPNILAIIIWTGSAIWFFTMKFNIPPKKD